MFWIFALGVVTLAVANKGFRKFLAVTALVIGIAFGSMVAVDQYQIHAKAETAAAKYATLPLCSKEISNGPEIYRDLDARAAGCRLPPRNDSVKLAHR